MAKNIEKLIGAQIARVRKERGMTQERLAASVKRGYRDYLPVRTRRINAVFNDPGKDKPLPPQPS